MEATHTQVNDSKLGRNRTGIQASPVDARALEKEVPHSSPPAPETLRANSMRQRHAREADPLGSVPLPGTFKGAAKTALQALEGNRAAAVINMLGERLAFERTGVRLYEMLMVKCEALGSWEGGPTRELLQQQCEQELNHFHLLTEVLQDLGADPTAMTPAAAVSAIEASGMLKVIADPSIPMSESLHAMLTVEDADNDGWQMLVEVAANTGQKDLADRFRNALAEEQAHKQRIHEWLGKAFLADARRQSDGDGQRPSMH